MMERIRKLIASQLALAVVLLYALFWVGFECP